MDTPSSRLQQPYRLRFWYVALFIPLLCCVAFGITRVQNDTRLQVLATAMMRVPLPPQTERLNQETHIGALVGLHNHCDYAVEHILATRLSAGEVTQFYRTTTILVGDGSSKRLPIDVIIDHERLADGRLRVRLRAIDTNQPKGFELRCQ